MQAVFSKKVKTAFKGSKNQVLDGARDSGVHASDEGGGGLSALRCGAGPQHSGWPRREDLKFELSVGHGADLVSKFEILQRTGDVPPCKDLGFEPQYHKK